MLYILVKLTIVNTLIIINTEWKVSKYGVLSGPYFPVFGLNTEIYFVNIRIQSENREIRTRKNSVFGHFSCSVILSNCLESVVRLPWVVSESYRILNKLLKILKILKELFHGLKEFFKVLNELIWKFLHELFKMLSTSPIMCYWKILLFLSSLLCHLFYFFWKST